ncbi:MAG: hypothetical protein ACKVU4_06855 [Phycisphaerales bacterium]
MKRAMLAAAGLMIVASAGTAQAGGWCSDGWRIGLSIGTSFRIGDCGRIGIGIGVPLYRDRGWDDCGPGYYRGHRSSWRDRCDDGWSRGHGRYYASADPVIIGGAYAAARNESPSVVTHRNDAAGRAATTRVANAARPIEPTPAELEVKAWKALADGDSAAMEMFGQLVSRSRTAGSAEYGYAVAAVQAGQVDRAAWAIRQASRVEGAIDGVPKDDATKAAVASVLARFDGAGESPGNPSDRAIVLAALKSMAGEPMDAPGAATDSRSAESPKAAATPLAAR